MQTARLYVLSHAETRVSYLPSPRPIGRQRSVANPRGAGEMRAKGGCVDPSHRVPPKRVRRQNGAPIPSFTLNLPARGVRGPSVYFSAASRPIELSLQSSFQLSLMVLVNYRSRAEYLALDGVYHPS